MKKIRILPRLDVKNDTVVKGIHHGGLRIVGKSGGNVILVIANNRKYIHDAQDTYLLS